MYFGKDMCQHTSVRIYVKNAFICQSLFAKSHLTQSWCVYYKHKTQKKSLTFIVRASCNSKDSQILQ